MENVRSKLNVVQSKLNAPKNQFNRFGNYNYRSNEDILQGVKPLLEEVGAIIVQSDEIKMIGDRFYIVATSIFMCCESGDTIENTSYAREAMVKKGMDDSQITGSTSSYARKYSLNGLLLIDDSKDADTMDNSNHHNDNSSQEPEKEWLNDVSGVVKYARENNIDCVTAVSQARKKYKVSKKVADEIVLQLSTKGDQ